MSDQITALAIQIKGEIVSSNFEGFKANALEKIEGMKYELLNDDDFAKAKKDIKDLEVTGKALKTAKVEVFKQLDDVYRLMGGIDEIISAAMPAGAALVYLGSTMHGGGENVTSDIPRRGMFTGFIVGWLRTEENFFLSTPIEAVRTMPERVQSLLGYDTHLGIGVVDVGSPRARL